MVRAFERGLTIGLLDWKDRDHVVSDDIAETASERRIIVGGR